MLRQLVSLATRRLLLRVPYCLSMTATSLLERCERGPNKRTKPRLRPKEKLAGKFSASRRKVTECHECFKSEALASSAQDRTQSINPGQVVRNSFRALH